jgi:nucleotide-binding universal stress UspA family protein
MNANKKILVAVDGSKQAFDTARYAARMLSGCGARIVLFHVRMNIDEAFYDIGINPAGRQRMAAIRAWESEQHKEADEMMAKAGHIMEEAGIARDRITIMAQPRKVGIARDIIKESHNGYSAVVIGRKGHHAIKGLVLGSVANKLIGQLRHVTLWVVGGNPGPNKLLVGLDASEGAMRAVDHVVSTRNGFHQRQIVLMHAARTWRSMSPIPTPMMAPVEEERIEALIAEASESIEPVFKEATQRLERAGYKPDRIQTEIISGVESRAMAMIQYARANDIGTLVMGRRGLSRAEDFIMGRVGHKIVNTVRNRAVWIVV